MKTMQQENIRNCPQGEIVMRMRPPGGCACGRGVDRRRYLDAYPVSLALRKIKDDWLFPMIRPET
jgi:hypothetical protein